MSPPADALILGAGIAGLGCGYYLRRAGIEPCILEAAEQVGGNARTLEHAGFRFDSGAHRFHDKDREATALVRELLGDELRPVHAPSRIYHRGAWVDFPLRPLNLLRALGPATLAAGGLEVLRRGFDRAPVQSFEDHARRRYGARLAERFLLGYSEKLWGLPCSELAPEIASTRLRGLGVATLVRELWGGPEAAVEHLDGAFYYPRGGFGTIAEALARAVGPERVRLGSEVTRVHTRGRRVTAVELRGGETLEARHVVNTLPLTLLVRLLDPPPPDALLAAASRLRFRDVKLVVVLLDRPRVTDNATVYFPDREVPFTRVTEPNNRSPAMSPPGKTSLVAEVPCRLDDPALAGDDELAAQVIARLAAIGWLRPGEPMGADVVPLRAAYPILHRGYQHELAVLEDHLGGFHNLHGCGRGARFAYSHCHDLLRAGAEVARAIG